MWLFLGVAPIRQVFWASWQKASGSAGSNVSAVSWVSKRAFSPAVPAKVWRRLCLACTHRWANQSLQHTDEVLRLVKHGPAASQLVWGNGLALVNHKDQGQRQVCKQRQKQESKHCTNKKNKQQSQQLSTQQTYRVRGRLFHAKREDEKE